MCYGEKDSDMLFGCDVLYAVPVGRPCKASFLAEKKLMQLNHVLFFFKKLGISCKSSASDALI